MTRWAILTGEYPPQPGGVSDYTRLVVAGLSAAGDEVRVFAPPAAGNDSIVTRLPDHFGPRGLWALDRALSRFRPDRILIQYVPQAFGWKGMNVPFAVWVAARAVRFAPVWVMFHEVLSGTDPRRVVRNAVITHATRLMARLLTRAADRVFVSIPAWGELVLRIARPRRQAEWLPIPSTLPAVADPTTAAEVRGRVAPNNECVVGHFGTFGSMNTDLLAPALAALLRPSARRVALLVGRNGPAFRDRFTSDHPDIAERVTVTGELSPPAAAAHLAACDVMLQPYPDGATARRTSLMAGLALGVPTVTNVGFLSEAVWGTESAGVAVAPSPAAADLIAAAEGLLSLPQTERRSCAAAASEWYGSRFAIEHTITRLRSGGTS